MASTAQPTKSGWHQFLQDNPEKKKSAGHNERNQEPIAEELRRLIPRCKPAADATAATCTTHAALRVLEIASGTGQHSFYMPTNICNLIWQGSDYDDVCIESISEWSRDVPNGLQPIKMDATWTPEQWTEKATQPGKPFEQYDILYTCNMIHIAPIDVMYGLIAGAGAVVKPGGLLFIYGPFKVNGVATPESNANFDASLRARDSTWGIRDIEDLDERLGKVGFTAIERTPMPANNFLCSWRKTKEAGKL